MWGFCAIMKTRISISTFRRVSLAYATLLAVNLASADSTNKLSSDIPAALQRIQDQLEEQTRRIDRLYKALGLQLADFEERAAELEKRAREEKALALETIRQVTDQALSG